MDVVGEFQISGLFPISLVVHLVYDYLKTHLEMKVSILFLRLSKEIVLRLIVVQLLRRFFGVCVSTKFPFQI